MNTSDDIPRDDELDDFEASLRSLRPRAPSAGFADRVSAEARLREVAPRDVSEAFADRVITEGALRELSPREPSAGFADRVVAACVSGESSRRNVLRFPGVWAPFAAAAALALAFAPVLLRDAPESAGPAAVATGVAKAPASGGGAMFAASAPAVMSPEAGYEEAMRLPVIDLGDGRAYRPVLRSRVGAPSEFRAMPGGAVMPVSFPTTRGLEYEPVRFE